jgi:hypothetical protein
VRGNLYKKFTKNKVNVLLLLFFFFSILKYETSVHPTSDLNNLNTNSNIELVVSPDTRGHFDNYDVKVFYKNNKTKFSDNYFLSPDFSILKKCLLLKRSVIDKINLDFSPVRIIITILQKHQIWHFSSDEKPPAFLDVLF